MTAKLRSAFVAAVAGVALAALAAAGVGRAAPLHKRGEQIQLDPARFTTRIDNPYFPMRPGDRSVYRVFDSEGLRQRAVVKVLADTVVIANGVMARVVMTVVSERGRRVEDNHAWYAQDRAGNVWYFGELAREYDNGKVTTKGSWEAGVDGAQPGVICRPARE